MKKFLWRLQKVLDVNLKRQQAKRIELFKVSEKLVMARTNLLAQRRILQGLIENVAKKAITERMSHQELLLKSTKRNDELIKKYEDEIRRLELERKKLTEEFMKLRRSTKAMEKLREKNKQQFIAEQEKLEQKEMDEHTSMRFAGELIRS
jgi:flagellar export protein FliJ